MWRIDVARETLIGEVNWLRVIGMFVCIIFFILAVPYVRARLDSLRAIKSVLFPKEELLKYDLSKTAVDLMRLGNEIKGYIGELESDFSKQDLEPRIFEYTQMEPENRFVTQVLKQKKLFMEKYDRAFELFNHGEYVKYRRERDDTIKYGQELLKEIKATNNKLPLSAGHMGL